MCIISVTLGGSKFILLNHSALVRVNEELLERKVAAPV
jgi:hypothetical protein